MAQQSQIPLLGPGIAGKSLAVSAQKRQNLYLEVKPEKDKSNLVAYGTPGLKPFTNVSDQITRGMWWFQAKGLLYVVSSYALLEIAGDGTATYRGNLDTSTGTVSMTDNGTQLMITDGRYGYIFTPETPDLPFVGTKAGIFDPPLFTVTEPGYVRTDGEVVHVTSTNPGVPFIGTVSIPVIDATDITVGQHVTIKSVGTTNFVLIGATANEIGVSFYATGAGTGTGTVVSTDTWVMDGGGFGTAPSSGTLRVVNQFQRITAPGFQGGDVCVFLDGYFVTNIPNTKQFQISDPYNGLAWNALQFASKEAYTDNLRSVAVDNGNLVLIGDISIEYWQNTGAYPFPFERIAGSPTDVGLAALWSVGRCSGNLYFLARTRRGSLSIVKMFNYQPIVVSTPDLDYLLNSYPSPGDAIAFTYRWNGHEFYQISFGAAGVTWLYDATSEAWSTMTSGDDTRHYGQRGTQFNGQIAVSDYRNGNIYNFDQTTYTDNGDYIARELITPHTFASSSFNRVLIYRLRLDMEQGVGLADGQGQSPQVMLQVSRDGGYTYGNEMWASPGQAGEYLKRAEWRRLGASRSFVFKFRITDPVKVVLLSASAVAQEASK